MFLYYNVWYFIVIFLILYHLLLFLCVSLTFFLTVSYWLEQKAIPKIKKWWSCGEMKLPKIIVWLLWSECFEGLLRSSILTFRPMSFYLKLKPEMSIIIVFYINMYHISLSLSIHISFVFVFTRIFDILNVCENITPLYFRFDQWAI